MKALRNFLMLTVLIFSVFSCSEDHDHDSLENPETPTQTNIRTCGMDHHVHQLMKDPAYQKAHEDKLMRLSELVDFRSSCDDPAIIPVAIHFQNVSGADAACLVSLAQAQIQILNDDFKGTNSDISNWINNASSSFPGVDYAQTCLSFCLADINHPSGYGLVEGQPAVTINQTTGDQVNAFSGYLNFFVRPNTGYLGYAPLGGSGNGDGVVVDAAAFGTGSGCGNVSAQAPYNLGRTATHEVGHYFLLDHIWGGGCGSDDDVADTPDSADSYYDCPSLGAASCGSTDMHMNYMDYTNDACMYMFSAGQATRVENYVSSSLGILTNNASNVCSNAGSGTGGGGTGGGTGGGDPECTSVSDLSATAPNYDQIRLSWTAIPEAVQYQVRYKKSAETSYTLFTTNDVIEIISNLEQDTEYVANVRVQCSEEWTTWSAPAYITTPEQGGGGGSGSGSNPGCAKVNDLSVSNIGQNNATISWTGFEDAIRYKVRYKEIGQPWTKFNTNNTEEVLSGLLPNTTYKVAVRVRCANGWTTWSSNQQFTTTGSTGGGGNGCNLNTIEFQLTLDNYGSETSWELVNEDTGTTVLTGGPYEDGIGGTTITETLCVPDACYTIYVDDSYGDGICCDYGSGSFEILDVQGEVIGYSDGQFGYYDYIQFCVSNNNASFKKEEKDPVNRSLQKVAKTSAAR